jgi:hypothetical protein
MMSRLDQVLEAIDRANAADPHREADGSPKELAYSKRLTDWVLRLEPQASEFLRIAARGQHVGRWKVPRASYPLDRGGYLRWREDLKKLHARTVAEIMEQAGYSEEERRKVQEIILKRNLRDPDTQTVEDALCLEFLATQFDDLKNKTPDDKMAEIVRKTWKKMSARGQDSALKLDLRPDQRSFLEAALSAV